MTTRGTTQSWLSSQIVRLHARKFLSISLFFVIKWGQWWQNDVRVLYVRYRKK